MAEFIKVAAVSDVADPGKLQLEVGERLVVLFRVDGQFFCLDDVCTHDGGPLGEGRLAGYDIACPRHGAKFDVRSGQARTMPATENTVAHDVKVDAGSVWVRIRDGQAEANNPAATSAVAKTNAADDAACCGGGTHTVLTASSMSGVTVPASDAGAAVGGTATVLLCEDLVREELKRVIDPELFVNIVDLGLVYDVTLLPAPEGGTKVKIDMTMTSPMCPAGPQMIAQCKQVLGQMPGVQGVEVRVVMDPPWSPEKMSDAAKDQLGIF